jgi:hypothetical protein
MNEDEDLTRPTGRFEYSVKGRGSRGEEIYINEDFVKSSFTFKSIELEQKLEDHGCKVVLYINKTIDLSSFPNICKVTHISKDIDRCDQGGCFPGKREYTVIESILKSGESIEIGDEYGHVSPYSLAKRLIEFGCKGII